MQTILSSMGKQVYKSKPTSVILVTEILGYKRDKIWKGRDRIFVAHKDAVLKRASYGLKNAFSACMF